MDHLRGLITLNVDKLTLYELSGFVQDQPSFNESRDTAAQDMNTTGNEISNLEQEVNRLRLEITKVIFYSPETIISLVETILFALGTSHPKRPSPSKHQTRSSIVEIKHVYFVVHSFIHSLSSSTIKR